MYRPLLSFNQSFPKAVSVLFAVVPLAGIILSQHLGFHFLTDYLADKTGFAYNMKCLVLDSSIDYDN